MGSSYRWGNKGSEKVSYYTQVTDLGLNPSLPLAPMWCLWHCVHPSGPRLSPGSKSYEKFHRLPPHHTLVDPGSSICHIFISSFPKQVNLKFLPSAQAPLCKHYIMWKMWAFSLSSPSGLCLTIHPVDPGHLGISSFGGYCSSPFVHRVTQSFSEYW